MKLAIFADNFLPQVNGVVTATINLIKGMADRGNEVLVVAPRDKIEQEFYYKNVKVIRVLSLPAIFYPDLRITSPVDVFLLNLIRKERVDVLHFVAPLTLGLQSIIIAKTLKLPLVGTFHTFFADKEYLKHAKLNIPFMDKVGWAYSNRFYNRCDLVTSPSEYTKKEMIRHRCKVKIKVISNGIDPGMFDNSMSTEVRKKYAPNSKLILFLGRIAHEKNISYLLDCFKLVLEKYGNVKLLFVGDGPQMSLVKNKIKNLGIEEKVIIAGKINHEKLVKSGLFGACDLFVTASKTENQPMTVLEAQQNGLVCVGLSEKGMIDLIDDGKNGFLLKDGNKKGFAEAIVKLLKSDKLRNKMSTITKEMIKKHHIDNVIREWEKTYNNLINKK